MRKILALVLLLSLPSLASPEKIPADAWQPGTLKDVSESWHTRGGGAITGNQYGVHGAMGSHEYPIMLYTIETDAFIYNVELTLPNGRSKRPALTVNAPVKFTIEKSNFLIKDEQGKEYKLVIGKKTLKASSPAP